MKAPGSRVVHAQRKLTLALWETITRSSKGTSSREDVIAHLYCIALFYALYPTELIPERYSKMENPSSTSSLSRMTIVLSSASEVLTDLASVSRNCGKEGPKMLLESLELLIMQLNHEVKGLREVADLPA